MKEINDELYAKLVYLGIISKDNNDTVRDYNIGSSDYAEHIVQPWTIWLDWHLNPFDADIIKRVLRNKLGQSRKEDYEKIIHICKERIRQIETKYGTIANNIDFENVE